MAVKERTTIALDPEVKREATDVLERMGLSLSSFTEICLRQAVRDCVLSSCYRPVWREFSFRKSGRF